MTAQHVVRLAGEDDEPDMSKVPQHNEASAFTYGDSPHEIAHDNFRRASFAGSALHAYADITFNGGEGEAVETVLGDLLSDMRHLCDVLGLDYEHLANRTLHYDDEIVGAW